MKPIVLVLLFSLYVSVHAVNKVEHVCKPFAEHLLKNKFETESNSFTAMKVNKKKRKKKKKKKTNTYPIEWLYLEGLEYDELYKKLTMSNNTSSRSGHSRAISNNLLEANKNGKLSFNAVRKSGNLLIGLSNVNAGINYSSGEYAIYLTRTRVYICQGFRLNSYIGKYKQGDHFSIERKGNRILFKQNNRIIHSTATQLTKQLSIDVVLWGTDVLLEDLEASFMPSRSDWWDLLNNNSNCTENTNMNWVKAASYDRDGNKTAASKSFTNYLGKPLQTQVKNLTEKAVFASQPIYDAYGRAVIQTMSAPTFEQNFCYKENFVTNADGAIYDYEDFDLENYSQHPNLIRPGELDKPKPVGTTDKGTLGWYYSSNNNEEFYTPNTSYPYTRVVYDPNNPGRQKKVAGPGDQHRMGSGHEQQSYTMLEAGELMFVYGPLQSWIENDDLPAYQITKSISIDPDGKQVVTFADMDGKLVASCLAGQVNGQNTHNLAVSSTLSEMGYVDIHLPEGCQNSLRLFNTSNNDYTYKILDLQSNRYQLFSGSEVFYETEPELPAGFYRIIETSGFHNSQDIPVNYELNYYEFALNYYDKAGRLVKTIPPLGINTDFLENGLGIHVNPTSYESEFRLDSISNETALVEYYPYQQGNPNSKTHTLEDPTHEVFYTELTLGFSGTDIDYTSSNIGSGSSGSGGSGGSGKTAGGNVSAQSETISRASRNFNSKSNNHSASADNTPSLRIGIDTNEGDDIPNDYINTCYKYELKFNLKSGVAAPGTVDIIEEGEISLKRCLNSNLETDYIHSYITKTTLDSEQTNITDQVKVELLSLKKWEIRNFQTGPTSVMVHSIDLNDRIFLMDYKIKLEAVNYESNTLAHTLSDTYEYNSLNWLLSSTTTDGGKTDYVYRKDGSLRFSENAVQREKGAFSYSNYDPIGRVTEVGEYTNVNFTPPIAVPTTVNLRQSSDPMVRFTPHYSNQFITAPGQTTTLAIVEDQEALDTTYCHQQTFYSYDKADANFYIQTGLDQEDYRQTFMAGQLAKSWTAKPHTSTTWYSYDEQGRLVWMVQDLKDLGVKTLEYQYDAKGNVSQVSYQNEEPDEAFHHKYTFNKDNQLLKVYTSVDDSNWKKEAEYEYYLHGPLKRVELADDLQGIDYIYTVQGQLKSINSPNLGSTSVGTFYDPGKDHLNQFAPDVFGMSIDYYAGDYSCAGSYVNSTGGLNSSYSGNISAVRWNTKSEAMNLAGSGKQNAYNYTYDHHNWLTGATFGTYSPSSNQNSFAPPNPNAGPGLSTNGASLGADPLPFSPNPNEDYKLSNLTYDANGNIASLHRNGYTSNSLTNSMDALNYNYAVNAQGNRTDNKLAYLSDVTHSNDYADVKDQVEDNYSYNALGQLVHNAQEEHYYTYDAYGLLTGVYKDEFQTQPVANYFYDDKGFRTRKALYDTDYTLSQVTWYVRDVSGNLLSLYEEEAGGIVKQTEVPLYAATRIGQYHGETQKRIYELTDHLGNVRAVIKREKDANNRAQIIKASDYYPFGMEMPGRKYASESYRYDYQGQFAEKDGETGLHSFEARLWDARIARWTSMDPVENFFSPYAGMHNNPISQVDPDGRFPLIAIAIGALTNAVIQNYKGNINNFGDFVSAMVVGAVKGAGSYAVGQFVGGIVGSNSLSLADEGVGVFASSDPTLLDEILLTASRGGGFDFSNTVSTLLSFGGCVYGGFGTPDFNMNLYPNSTLLPTVDVYAYQNGGIDGYGESFGERLMNLPRAMWNGDVFPKDPNTIELVFDDGLMSWMIPGGGPLKLAKWSKALVKTRTQFSKHSLQRLAQRGVTPKGFKQVKNFGYQHGQKVYKYKGKFYSRDIDGHNGGVWKVFENAGGRLKRIGTADHNLNIFKN